MKRKSNTSLVLEQDFTTMKKIKKENLFEEDTLILDSEEYFSDWNNCQIFWEKEEEDIKLIEELVFKQKKPKRKSEKKKKIKQIQKFSPAIFAYAMEQMMIIEKRLLQMM